MRLTLGRPHPGLRGVVGSYADYGSRDLTVTDPDSNRWSLGTYRGAAA